MGDIIRPEQAMPNTEGTTSKQAAALSKEGRPEWRRSRTKVEASKVPMLNAGVATPERPEFLEEAEDPGCKKSYANVGLSDRSIPQVKDANSTCAGDCASVGKSGSAVSEGNKKSPKRAHPTRGKAESVRPN